MEIMKCGKDAFPIPQKMEEYPGLTEKVTLAGPDVVADYRNKASNHDAEGWVKQSVLDADSIIGIYDVHSYPGQMKYVTVNIQKYWPVTNSTFPKERKSY